MKTSCFAAGKNYAVRLEKLMLVEGCPHWGEVGHARDDAAGCRWREHLGAIEIQLIGA